MRHFLGTIYAISKVIKEGGIKLMTARYISLTFVLLRHIICYKHHCTSLLLFICRLWLLMRRKYMLKALICFYIAGNCCSNDFDAAISSSVSFFMWGGCSARLCCTSRESKSICQFLLDLIIWTFLLFFCICTGTSRIVCLVLSSSTKYNCTDWKKIHIACSGR
jgi:hypothetical protein